MIFMLITTIAASKTAFSGFEKKNEMEKNDLNAFNANGNLFRFCASQCLRCI